MWPAALLLFFLIILRKAKARLVRQQYRYNYKNKIFQGMLLLKNNERVVWHGVVVVTFSMAACHVVFYSWDENNFMVSITTPCNYSTTLRRTDPLLDSSKISTLKYRRWWWLLLLLNISCFFSFHLCSPTRTWCSGWSRWSWSSRGRRMF